MNESTIFDSPTRTVCDNLDKFGYGHRRNQFYSWTEHNRSFNANRGRGQTRSRKAMVVTSVSRGTGRTTTYEL